MLPAFLGEQQLGGEAGDGCVKRFMSLLYGVLRVPAFGGGVWRGCRHAAKPCPGSQGLQTSRGVTVAGTGLVSCLFQPMEHRKDRGNVWKCLAALLVGGLLVSG